MVGRAAKRLSGLGRGWDVRLPDLSTLVRRWICQRFLRAHHTGASYGRVGVTIVRLPLHTVGGVGQAPLAGELASVDHQLGSGHET